MGKKNKWVKILGRIVVDIEARPCPIKTINKDKDNV